MPGKQLFVKSWVRVLGFFLWKLLSRLEIYSWLFFSGDYFLTLWIVNLFFLSPCTWSLASWLSIIPLSFLCWILLFPGKFSVDSKYPSWTPANYVCCQLSASIRVGMLLLRIMENFIAFFEKLEISPVWLLEELFLPIAAFPPPSSYCLKTSSSIESFLMSLSKLFSSLYLRQAFFYDSLYSPLNFGPPALH